MILKKISCLCVALLLLVGVSSVADAATPQGVRLRIEHPANDAWAGIGDSVVVSVEFLPGTAALDTVIVGIVADTTTTVMTSFNSLYSNTFTSGATGPDSDGFKKFKKTFLITAGHTVASSAKTLNLSARVSTTSLNGFVQLNNLNVDAVINGASSFGLLGDSKKIGIDPNRPSASIDSVRLDTTGLTNFPNDGGGPLSDGNNASTNPKKAFKTGSKVKVSFYVSNVPSSASGLIHLVDTSNVTSLPDSAMKTVEFAFAKLVSGSATDSTTITLGAGDVKGNNRRIVAVAFLKDAAGNLSSSGANDVTPVGITDFNMHVLDVNSPTITPLIPKSAAGDSVYFTARADTALQIVPSAGGATTGVTYAANPLKFKVSEGPKSAKATFNSVAATLTTAPTTLIAGNSFTASFTTSFAETAQSGKKSTLKLTVVDSAGNSTDKSEADVTYDKVAPGIKAGSLFPTKASAPPDAANSNAPTVNRATMMPILQLLEKTDSLAARYIGTSGSPAVKAIQTVASGDASLAITDKEIQIIFVDSLNSNKDYTLQFLLRDLAGNHNATVPDTLTFDADFQNPVADSFVVAASGNDSIVIAGQALILNATGIDTALTRSSGSQRAAVTHSSAAIITVNTGDQDKSGVTISGTGVTDNKDGTASLSAAGWSLGTRAITIKSTKKLTKFSATVSDSATGLYSGLAPGLEVNSANLASYNVSVVTDGTDDTAAGVSGGFKVKVVPADRWGNPSNKIWLTGQANPPTRADSTAMTDAKVDSSKLLGEIFTTLSSNNGDISVPQGPQSVNAVGSVFTVGGATTSGDGLYITVRSVNTNNDSTGLAVSPEQNDEFAIGKTGSLTFVPEGEAVQAAAGTLAAPANLIVQDWLGSAGTGDQGGFVTAAFPKAVGAARYRVFRQLSVSTGVDSSGALVALDTPTTAWVSWTVVDHIDADAVQRTVIPTLDNVATSWAVASESGGSSSERTATKRVFTKQIVQNMVKFLGVDPNRVLSMTELAQAYTPSQDYVKSILGDQTGITIATIDPNLSTMLSAARTVPQNIRTQASGVKTSARTETEAPVKAVDNIAPTAATAVEGANNSGTRTLTWTASVDDKIVGYSSYKGYAVPIAGVDRYDIYRGATAETLQLIGSVSGGVTSFTDAADLVGLSSVIYRVDAADLDNTTPSALASVSIGGRPAFLNAEGIAIYIINEDDGSPNTVDFGDFISFAGSFNLSAGEPGFVANADTDDSGTVDFNDFLGFAASFNQTVATRNGVPVASTKPILRTLQPGVNDNVEFSMNLGSDKVLVGQTVTVNVTVDNAASLQGFGFDLSYDTDKFEFVEAAPASEDLLKGGGAETPVFLHQLKTPGELTVANAIVDGSPVSGNGDVVSLTFRVLTEFEDNARFEIASGIVFDGSKLSNPVVALGSLNVESTPTEFALLQNFPNPFNPETTIKYNVANGANVSLRIYNVVGQVVKTLVAEQQNAGRYTVRWSGTDDRGVSVSSGIYFYQITAGSDFQDVKKLMLLK
jgi:hypothetical protein